MRRTQGGKQDHAQKLRRAQEEFINLAAHQLKTPLTVIKGVAAMMISGQLEKFSETEKRKFYQSVWSRCRKLETIISDILNAASFTNGKFDLLNQPADYLDLRLILEKVVLDFQPEAEQRGLIVAMVPEDILVPSIYGQREYLEEAFVNLVTNAIKYTPSAKKSEDVRQVRKKGQGRVLVNLEVDKKNKNWVLVTIRDNGIGIAPDELPNLFEKFYRADNAKQMYMDGSGLGLFIVKEIIEGHGGKIRVKSQLGQGTTFYIRLPRKPRLRPNIKKYIAKGGRY